MDVQENRGNVTKLLTFFEGDEFIKEVSCYRRE